MLYIYIKEIIKRLNFIIFGILFSLIFFIIYKEELVYNLILFYFKIFKFQILLLTGIFDKLYIEILLIYLIFIITIILLSIINLVLFCIPIITKKNLNNIIKNIYYLIFIFFFYFFINLFFIIIINILKNNNNTYIFLQKNIINEIRLIEYKNFIIILLFSNIIIFFVGVIIFYIIIKLKNLSYKYFINIRLLNFLFLSILLIFILPSDYILHFIILMYYLIYIEGLFIITIFIKNFYKYIKNKY